MSKTEAKNNERKSLTEKINELERATEWFYSDEFNLDAATEKYEKAIEMAKEIEDDLKKMKNKIEIVEKDFTKD